ncbi:MAG: TIGR03663 family protein [Anaerolineae bacterium]|nr:TIGR03663 family protein [Anaerolineae bacterium]
MMNKQKWLVRPVHPALPGITNEVALFAAILLLSIVTRFYDLETRVMSHDESLHTYFSWLFYRGQGYQHSPMMHGPLQFHLLSLTYFLFGVSDFTARIPAAIFSIASVWMVWYWRRYLGRTGALIAAFLMVISPFMLYYGRYVRNEAYVGLSGLLMLYAILRYLEIGNKKYIYLITLSLVIHFTAKETAFIYAAQALLFLGILFIARVTNKPWEGKIKEFRTFIILLIVGILLIGGAIGYNIFDEAGSTLSSTETAIPIDPENPQSQLAMPDLDLSGTNIFILSGILVLIGAIVSLITGYGWGKLKKVRSFGLIILIGTLVLPLLAPFPIKFLEGWLKISLPTSAAEINTIMASPELILGLPRDLVIIGIFIAIMFAISAWVGLSWNRDWWKPAILFWGIFTVLYTSVFTNSDGFFTGLVGSLGYWLAQQGVERGSQPWYYYVLIQIPIYEFLPAIGTILAAYFGIKKLNKKSADIDAKETLSPELPDIASTPELEPATEKDIEYELEHGSVERNFPLTFSLLIWWIISSILILSYAGERMPWLTYHMAWPMILITGWGISQLIKRIEWEKLRSSRTAVSLTLPILFVLGLGLSVGSILGPNPPFAGKNLEQLQATVAFLLPVILTIGSIVGMLKLLDDEITGFVKVALVAVVGMGFMGALIVYLGIPTGPLADENVVNTIWLNLSIIILITIACVVGLYLLRNRNTGNFPYLITLALFGSATILTMRASFRASFINYDSAKEYLVYAHGATGIKQIIAQAKEISERTTGGMDLALHYDASAPDTGVSWPFVWYLRDFNSKQSFDKPTRALRDSLFVIVDAKNFDKIEPALGPSFYRFDYIRMWWPNQDYFGLTKDRIINAIQNPQIRNGIWDIWFNRDFASYAAATKPNSNSLSPATWEPSDKMRLYIRKDIASQIWNYGAVPAAPIEIEDPTEGKDITLPANLVLDSNQPQPVDMNAPRSIAIAPDGSLYVADSRNHRILHLDEDGQLIETWGIFAEEENGEPPPKGTFNEPWGVAVGPDGSVYVSDTWNHRIQKFSSDGSSILTWGHYDPSELDLEYGFYGPRGLAVDAEGYVYVADTGNKRIVVFDAQGEFISEFGTAGFDPGQFDEPVGITVAKDGTVYVTDTWNKRIQTFKPTEDLSVFLPVRQWDVFGWYGQSLDNKPFIAVNSQGHVFVTDPEQYRIIEFTSAGEVVRTWGDFGETASTFGLASGIVIDAQDNVWVTDSLYNRILRFSLPE